MTYEVNEKQFESVFALPDKDRFYHSVSVICDWGEVWSLKNENGWVTLESDGRVCVPFWPHPKYVEYFISGDYEHCHPESITLENFVNNWLPGMQKDNHFVAVFPNKEFRGIVLEANKVLGEIEEELEKYG